MLKKPEIESIVGFDERDVETEYGRAIEASVDERVGEQTGSA